MRLAFFVPYFRQGGVETTTYRLASEFRDQGHIVDLITFQHDSPYLGPNSPFNVVDITASRTLTSLPAMVRFLNSATPDGIISTHYFANVISIVATLLSDADPKVIVTERLAPSHVINEEPWPKSWFFRQLLSFLYPSADHCVTVSKAAATDLQNLAELDTDQVTGIYNPTLTAEVYNKATMPVDHPWVGTEEITLLLGVGRLTKQKDFKTLIRAFARMRDKHGRDGRLIILGDGRKQSELDSLARELGVTDQLDLHGYVDNPYGYMKRADLFVLSSQFEGMPNVLVEALAVGTPVVATDCPTGPRELLDGGAGGELVPVGDVEAMADAMDRQLGDSGRVQQQLEHVQDTLEEFRPEQSCKRYLALIDGDMSK